MLVYADISPKDLSVNQFSKIKAYLAMVYCKNNGYGKIFMFCFI